MTELCACPCCGAPMQEADPVAVEVQKIRSWCAANGIQIVLTDCIRQADAARYLGRAHQTLRNWGDLIPARRVRGRVYYRLSDVAEFVVYG